MLSTWPDEETPGNIRAKDLAAASACTSAVRLLRNQQSDDDTNSG